MILSTLENRQAVRTFYLRKRVIPYAIVTLICALFAFIYSRFAHGVSSHHMTFLFAYPLIMGVDAGLVSMLFIRCKPQSFFASHFYHTGVVALILSSILRGVFEIAGTSSIYEDILLVIGVGFTALSIIFYVVNCMLNKTGKGQ